MHAELAPASAAAVQLPVTEFGTQGRTVVSRISRRHLPICTTTGMFVPLGTFVSVKEPSVAVVVTATALSAAAPPQVLHVAPVVKAGSGAVALTGMYTVALRSEE